MVCLKQPSRKPSLETVWRGEDIFKNYLKKHFDKGDLTEPSGAQLSVEE